MVALFSKLKSAFIVIVCFQLAGRILLVFMFLTLLRFEMSVMQVNNKSYILSVFRFPCLCSVPIESLRVVGLELFLTMLISVGS